MRLRKVRPACRVVRPFGANRSRANQRGSATMFVLGVAIAVLMLGGLSVDFWRAIAARRALAAMADAAATAGANGTDPGSLRSGGMNLDPNVARDLAAAQLQQGGAALRIGLVDIDTNNQRVVVTLQQHIEFSLLSLFGDHRGFTVRVSATAAPTRG